MPGLAQGVRPKSATYLKFIYACFRLRQPDKAYEMLLNMEKEWRVPDAKDYTRMLNLFKWANHQEGQSRCLKGLVQDMQHGVDADGAPKLSTLNPNVASFQPAAARPAAPPAAAAAGGGIWDGRAAPII